MALTIHCDIVSAEAQIFSGLVELLVANGSNGELGVTYGHTPLLTDLTPGSVRVVLQGGEEEVYYVSAVTSKCKAMSSLSLRIRLFEVMTSMKWLLKKPEKLQKKR